MKVALPRTIQSIQLTRETAGFFYGVVLANGTNSGVGGVIKLSDKSSITWTCNCGPGTNTRAEFLGIWATLLPTTRLHIYNLQVLGD
jgi:hypothetical protein